MKGPFIVVLSFAAPLVTADVQGGDADVSQWEWTLVNDNASWIRRAGLQVVELEGTRYLMGGRTSREPTFPPIPGDSDIWADVWKSEDDGVTWELILDTETAGHWPARAYFRAVGKGDRMYVLGGQDYGVVEDPTCLPPFDGCLPFISVSNFFNDVWWSEDGVDWTLATPDAGWSTRAGLSATVFQDEIYVVGGSFLDDPAVIGGPPIRIYYNDVWKSSDGESWVKLVEEGPFKARAGGVLVAKDDAMYLIGGENGFTCEPVPCEPPYFNDVWRSSDGIEWELITSDAGWAPRPGHQVAVIEGQFVLFGGFGLSQDPADPFQPANPMDVWVSEDGAVWTEVSDMPWNSTGPSDIKYDFAITAGLSAGTPAIYTYGGDRETFNFFDPFNYLNVDNDVWRFGPAKENTCPGDVDDSGVVDVTDLIMVIMEWGPCADCAADIDGNGEVDVNDLVTVIVAWGPCERG